MLYMNSIIHGAKLLQPIMSRFVGVMYASPPTVLDNKINNGVYDS